MAADSLSALRRATARRSRSEADWKAQIVAARERGVSLRTIAAAAGVSHVRVIQILRGD